MKYISTTSRCAILYRSERLLGSGLNGYQSGYILNICRKPGITQDQLAQQLHVNRSNVTRQLALLEENGFVGRSQSESDKRSIEVYPTKKAVATMPIVQNVLYEWNDYLTEDFTEEEKKCFISLLERVAHKAENYADGMRKDG
jgi:DNA-binding MarR family transcriptional regulator